MYLQAVKRALKQKTRVIRTAAKGMETSLMPLMQCTYAPNSPCCVTAQSELGMYTVSGLQWKVETCFCPFRASPNYPVSCLKTFSLLICTLFACSNGQCNMKCVVRIAHG